MKREFVVQTTVQISGMTCEHCVKAVSAELGAIDGVSSVTVDLVPDGISSAHVTSADAISHDDIAAAIDEAGYELVAG